MKRSVLISGLIVLSFFSASLVISGQPPAAESEKAMWDAYNPKGERVGTIKEENGHYVFYDKDKIDLRQGDKENEWKMVNQKNEFVGTLRYDKDVDLWRIYDRQDKFIGSILKSGALLPLGHRRKMTRVPPEAARLYLHALEAYKNQIH